MSETIDWNAMNVTTEDVPLDLREDEVGNRLTVAFTNVKETENGMIVADITCEEVPGANHMWLKGNYGAQNGLFSLIKAADGGENIAGNTYTYTKVVSEKSPVGYAHRWTV